MKHLFLIFMFFIIIACNTSVNNQGEEDNTPLDLVSDDTVSEEIVESEESYRQITFNEILNDPFQFDDKEELFSMYATDNLNYSRRYYSKPKTGSVEALEISKESVDFGKIYLTILLNEWICYENLINGIESGAVYILRFKIYDVNESDNHMTLWADLLSKPERR